MKGKICLVTGATSGIGKATAAALAQSGATVIVHGRDRAKTEQIQADLHAGTGNRNTHAMLADFSSLAEVAALARGINRQFGALHVLINNAGVLTDHRRVSKDGFELTFAVNHLAPFLLTNLLLDTLIESAPARIATNSSSAMGGGYIVFDDLQMERHFDGWSAYANTKLANFLFSNLLAEKLGDTDVTSNSFCPGLVDTDLLTGNRDFGASRVAYIKARMRSAEEGATTPVYLATDPEAGKISGKFFLNSHGNGKTPVAISWDRNVAEHLWTVSLELVQPWFRPGRPRKSTGSL